MESSGARRDTVEVLIMLLMHCHRKWLIRTLRFEQLLSTKILIIQYIRII